MGRGPGQVRLATHEFLDESPEHFGTRSGPVPGVQESFEPAVKVVLLMDPFHRSPERVRVECDFADSMRKDEGRALPGSWTLGISLAALKHDIQPGVRREPFDVFVDGAVEVATVNEARWNRRAVVLTVLQQDEAREVDRVELAQSDRQERLFAVRAVPSQESAQLVHAPALYRCAQGQRILRPFFTKHARQVGEVGENAPRACDPRCSGTAADGTR